MAQSCVNRKMPEPMTSTAEPQGRDSPSFGQVGLRLYELALVILGLVFVLGDDLEQRIWYLALWDIGAIVYLLAGSLRVWQLVRSSGPAPGRSRYVPTSRIMRALFEMEEHNLFSTFAMSLTGVAAAVTIVLYRDKGDLQHRYEVLAVLAMICAWMMLHAGYARLYERLYYKQDTEGGLQFPADTQPNFADFIYFSFTLGATFAVSDVNVTNRRMRWHVTVHSVVSFFYNSAVLALAVGIITGP
jgi:uncharacterized membrane protein